MCTSYLLITTMIRAPRTLGITFLFERNPDGISRLASELATLYCYIPFTKMRAHRISSSCEKTPSTGFNVALTALDNINSIILVGSTLYQMIETVVI